MKVIIFLIIKNYLIIGICDVTESIIRDSTAIFGNRNVVLLEVYKGVTIKVQDTPKISNLHKPHNRKSFPADAILQW